MGNRVSRPVYNRIGRSGVWSISFRTLLGDVRQTRSTILIKAPHPRGFFIPPKTPDQEEVLLVRYFRFCCLLLLLSLLSLLTSSVFLQNHCRHLVHSRYACLIL